MEQITNTEKAEAVPISFDRHVYFINFTKFDKQWPIYVNLIRDPVEKAISRYAALIYLLKHLINYYYHH